MDRSCITPEKNSVESNKENIPLISSHRAIASGQQRKDRWKLGRGFSLIHCNNLYNPIIWACTLLFLSLGLLFVQSSNSETFFVSVSRHSYPREPKGHYKNCDSKNFKKETLKLLYERPFANLFGTYDIHEYGASDITAYPGGDGLYVVMDNTYKIARVGSTIGNYSSDALQTDIRDGLLSWPSKMRPTEESEFEYIAYNATSGRYIVGQEAIRMSNGKLRSRSFDVSFDESSSVVWESCDMDFELSYRNKGFEGGIVVKGSNGRSFLITVCEGNYCRGHKKGRHPHGGRLIVMERVYEDGKCIFRTRKQIKFDINFQDYSALAMYGDNRIGILSQENSALFIGDLDIGEEVNGIKGGRIYDFPRNDNCEIIYCNLEGLYFLNERQIVVVSDTMKDKGRQAYRCRAKDESIHVMMIPTDKR